MELLRRSGLVIGLVMLLAGAALHAVTGHGHGLLLVGVLVIASALIERRYRQSRHYAPLDDRWQRTEERFIDPESGQAIEVWVDGLTGERRYVPLDGGNSPIG